MIVPVLLHLGSIIALGQNQRVSLHYNQAEVRTVLDDIEKQTGLIFSYSSRLVDDRTSVDISASRITIDSAMAVIFPDVPVRAVFMEQQIILKRERKKTESGIRVEISKPDFHPFTVSGYVRDVATGEVLIGATVSVTGISVGTISNKYGFFSLTLDQPVDSLICTYVGYAKQVQSLTRNNQVINFQLKEHLQSIVEVVIYSDEKLDEIRTTRSSEQKIRPEAVRKMPALFGEKDVIKSLAAIPGIKFYGDGSTIFYVRGGSRDQNYVTIDEAPVYNPMHLLGFFSTVVPDAVKDIQVYKGDFPANYGGRLSSLVDIRTKDGNMQQFGMDASFGLISSRLSIEGPIWKDRISYFISGRKSYFHRPLERLNPELNDLYFSDLHAKLNFRINEKNRLFFSVYTSSDVYQAALGSDQVAGISWRNSTSTLRWNHLFSDRLFSNITFYTGRYDYYMYTDLNLGNYWNSHIDNFSMKADFTWYISPTNTLRFGARIGQNFMNPGNYYVNRRLFVMPYEISTKSANESNLYASDQIILSDNLSLRVGLRLTAWNNIGPATEYSVENGSLRTDEYYSGQIYYSQGAADPRISLVYKNPNNDILKFSYSRTSQFEHLITNSISPFSTLEVWLPSGPNIKPQRSGQLTIGYTHKFGETDLYFESEAYVKKMRNQIDYKDHAKLLLNPFLESQLLFGEGNAYGIETMLSKKAGRLSGWLSYTLSRSFLQVQGINNNKPYPSYGDRPHDLSLFISYRIKPRLELTSNFIYMTGSPFTAPTAFYYYENIQVPIYDKRNNDRLPDYHRLDLALNWNLRKKEGRFNHELIFSVYNVYGRKNPVAIHFNKIELEGGQLVIPYDFYSKPTLVPSQMYLYQMVPSVSYHFSF